MTVWHPICTAPKNREIKLKGEVILSDEHFRNTGIRTSKVYGTGSWLWGEMWSGILGGKPSHWAEINDPE